MARRPSSVRPSVCPSVNFCQIASSRRQMAVSRPNLHTMDSRSACIQGVLKVKVKGHVIRALLCWHKNRFFSQANGLIATKLAHDGHQVRLHPGYAQGQGQGQRPRDIRTFLDSWNELLRHWRSGLHLLVKLSDKKRVSEYKASQVDQIIRMLYTTSTKISLCFIG